MKTQILVIFGGTGDLAMRKLLPALYRNHLDDALSDELQIVAVGRDKLERHTYQAKVREALHVFDPDVDLDDAHWTAFASRLDFVQMNALHAGDYDRLVLKVRKSARAARIFYLATPSELFVPVCVGLENAGLVEASSKVVLEKPLGHDLQSAQQINREVGAIFSESQIYRIDHYLGKETVQNLFALRFGNALFERLWNRDGIRDVQITIAEQVGVEGRGAFYERTGAMRDMVQNHLLQLLCILAMEPPLSLEADAVRDEKLKVLRSLKPLTPDDVARQTVRGQYTAGEVYGTPVAGYLDEPNIDEDSRTETFVALKAELNNWRWAGVPFYLCTGKRLQSRVAEVVVNFRDVPHAVFGSPASAQDGNRLVIRLQPDESLKLYLMTKSPGDEMTIRPVSLNLEFSSAFASRRRDAYERLLLDVIRGRLTLFMRGDELDAAWRWIDPIIQAWQVQDRPEPYSAGSEGPEAALAMLGQRRDASCDA
ncbi:TPA: glucose-6-phosphate dehydrogenase [Burkholderia aenigmatica]|uniref:glucose-6-phosphate dehydrogenase n=1 Tax=Burkholderia sp. AU45251 TaxID=3059204 RepID=UPI00264D6CD3|nr:glucose-6-phosphate dehydrogenase [Burkholderia sp. AU45251]HDR9488260.1 glucose-6-phosphate dehydrogenase [Burkholderia aenigmatica]MDN7521124.1 glucose-6-phosphate dehydrogenase [Burkholderia sp. AU45251]HDR9520078.1 glucose-6-phosphate dehydrogenase [Burkholderia aenigmatica]HDR9597184.1 glucose-6-phosphate dehydrogenase [Burkholderia aenigmatica]HDR9605077.1 glucose-6-phosphate dehydrogenase [Burkholderia aenigmatica]